ncbi:hypothetical protein [Rhodococcus sp. Eu-32]|uniref:hypothetical protein n=1 Tax=Rhodococcus sp. Eu-32 TaxID=1017319 RepID=UPI0014026694|nr:hypothetical protein [Rhodococcus sp. Eu-32]
MWITIAYADGRTESLRGNIAEVDLYSGHLYIKDDTGKVVAERDDVIGVSKLSVPADQS